MGIIGKGSRPCRIVSYFVASEGTANESRIHAIDFTTLGARRLHK